MSLCNCTPHDPSNRGCTAPDCALIADRVAQRCAAADLPVSPAGVATIARYLQRERCAVELHRAARSIVAIGDRKVMVGAEHPLLQPRAHREIAA